jgi:nicotinamide riboside transporter PnuC
MDVLLFLFDLFAAYHASTVMKTCIILRFRAYWRRRRRAQSIRQLSDVT